MLGPAEIREIIEAMGEKRKPETSALERLPLAFRVPLAWADVIARRLQPPQGRPVPTGTGPCAPSRPVL